MIKLNETNTKIDDFSSALQVANESLKMLKSRTGKGSEFTGWLDYAANMDKTQLDDMINTAEMIRKDADVFVVAGIGGSYLGAKSFITATSNYFENQKPEILFVGHNMDEDYIAELIDYIKDKSVYVNVISKSGTTTETAVSFRLLREFMMEKYGSDYAKRVVATTDKVKGALKTLADNENIKTFVIPDNIGGRYSVFTPVGLLPIAVSGVDIASVVKVNKDSMAKFLENSETNPALRYAAYRYYCYKSGKKFEVLSCFTPRFRYISEWYKQLFGESEGKDGKGIFPSAMTFTTDLHSLGQYMQDGERQLFETVIDLGRPQRTLEIMKLEDDFDNLNYLAGKRVSDVNNAAMHATVSAHAEGGVPVMVASVDGYSAESLTELYSFFMVSCGISAYSIEVNPFNQPGVEAYKTKMFKLLGKK